MVRRESAPDFDFGMSSLRKQGPNIRAFTPVFAGYAERCSAWPGSFQTRSLERSRVKPGTSETCSRRHGRRGQPVIQKRRQPGAAGLVVHGAVGAVGGARLGAVER